MWHHGGWDVVPPIDPGSEEGGDREPLVPRPSPPTLHVTGELDED
jgi:hypothetical protein